MNHYDYIIAGAGASGLSLLMHMLSSGQLNDKRILLVDRSTKEENDRTWCFWEKDHGLFDSIVCKRWKSMWFHGNDNSSEIHDISPYEYKMIRGIDFYEYCFNIVRNNPNIDIKTGIITEIYSTAAGTSLKVDNERFTAQYIFSSINVDLQIDKKTNYFLWQHFKGWMIETREDFFDAHAATLMDFRIDQKKDCRFVYVMPLSSNKALVEYTVFSEHRLEEDEYKSELASYCYTFLKLPKEAYEIVETEFGMIPMTNYEFPVAENNIIYIGSAGGQTKASSGYTFNFIQKHSARIVQKLLNKQHPLIPAPPRKFDFYDSILLRILTEKKLKGADVFTTLFTKNEMKEVFKFLDNESSLMEDLKLISSLPKISFLNAAVSHMIGGRS